jgi:hypothetical protein
MPLNLGAVGSEREFAAVHAKAADELEQVIASGNLLGDLETQDDLASGFCCFKRDTKS